jgi:hypothetical protein
MLPFWCSCRWKDYRNPPRQFVHHWSLLMFILPGNLVLALPCPPPSGVPHLYALRAFREKKKVKPLTYAESKSNQSWSSRCCVMGLILSAVTVAPLLPHFCEQMAWKSQATAWRLRGSSSDPGCLTHTHRRWLLWWRNQEFSCHFLLLLSLQPAAQY